MILFIFHDFCNMQLSTQTYATHTQIKSSKSTVVDRLNYLIKKQWVANETL